MTTNFTFNPNPTRVRFGTGAIQMLGEEIERCRISTCIVLCSPNRKDLSERYISKNFPVGASIFSAAPPEMSVAAFKTVLNEIEAHGANGLIALGGGSPIGLGKAVAAETGISYLAIPTTYSGSELAPNWHLGSGPTQQSGRGTAALPTVVIYDPSLTIGLPPATSAASGMNAMAHAVESLYGPNTNPVVQTMAEEAIRLLSASLPLIMNDTENLTARSDALKGAWFAAGFRAKTGLEHVIAQQVRQAFDLDHARLHAITLPYALAFNEAAVPTARTAIARALGVRNPVTALYELNRRLGLATGFKELGMPEDGIKRVADIIARIDFPNPRSASPEQIAKIIGQAWAGELPKAI
jgi:maleylacetate reductase